MTPPISLYLSIRNGVGPGRSYFVERGFDSKAELAVLVAESRRRAEELGGCPMSAEGIGRGLALTAT